MTYQKFLLCISSQGQDLYSHQKLNIFSSESGYRADDDDDADNAGRRSTTTRATYRQLIDPCLIIKNQITWFIRLVCFVQLRRMFSPSLQQQD